MTVADRIILGARVRTMTGPEAAESPEAVAVADGRILAVGPRSEVLALAGPGTDVIEHPSATILPGLVDAHSHPIYSLGIVRGLSLAGVHTRAGLRAALERGRDEQAGDEWFLAWGLDPSAFEGEPIGNAELHVVLGADRPAYIKMFDAHSGIASAAALARAGVTAPFDNPDGSGAVGDTEGRLTGHLLEFPTMELVERILPPHGFDDRVRQLRGLLGDMAAVGITTAHVMDLKDPDALELLAAIEAEGDLPVRLRISPWCEPTTTDAEVAALVAMQGRGGRRYGIEGIKLFIDGTVEGGTAWLATPDADGEGLAATWPEADAYAARIRLFDEQGIPTATHAIGERGIRFVAETLASLPAGGVPHRIEHIESAEDDVIALIGASGIVASMQPTHCTHHVRPDGSDDWSRRLGATRAGRAWRTGDVRRSGATLALGSDWPVAPFDPWEIMADAQTRRPTAHPGTPAVGADQALTAVEALEGYTTHAHRAIGSAGGALVPGAPADLIVLDTDPLTAAPEELLDARVLLTLVDGRPTHR
ncbi:amidohydrolase [Microbacterium capsulatum]|uniref:Amidohydrolase n=1 Tax=Microbacterium capsulatum TaxID=3041921 RepID=A0ABU0XIY4_9MICO|nr:amidohydrolase [Microbacterium sp. ASV81]MDQ4215096.1 amidohydrolase [Microbacterium sp. ASV81]